MKKILCILFLLNCFNTFGQDEFAKSLGLNLEKESDVAVYMMLYQIGLKDTGENILGNDTCIDVNRDEVGNTKLSFGIRTDAFQTGTVGFSEDNDAKFKHINGSLTQLFNFFKDADYQPKISVRSYADPQHNIMKKYAPDSAIAKKYSKKLFGKNAYSDDRFNTDSKRRNYLLAYNRGEEFIEKYFPDDLKGKIRTTPYNTADLEVGNNQKNSEQFACPNRRSIVVDIAFNPNLKIQSSPGEFTPGFKVASGADNNHNILAAVFDAKNKSMNDLPEYCQNQSTKQFLKEAQYRYETIRKTMSSSASINALYNILDQNLRESDIISGCNNFIRYAGEGALDLCLKARTQLKIAAQNYRENQSEENLYKLLVSMTTGRDIAHKNSLRQICRRSRPHCTEFQNMFLLMDKMSQRMELRDKEYNSSHFMDCFSNDLYYKKEFDDNIDEYITHAVELRDPLTGKMKLTYTEENIPNTPKGLGFLCQACGTGKQLKDNKLVYKSRAGNSDHTEEQHRDSLKTYDALYKNPDPKTMFMMGHQKGLNIYVIKDCKIDDFKSMRENAKMISVEDLQKKEIAIGPNDCIFKPKVINSCVHAPAGESDGDDSKMTYIARVPSFLTNKTISTVNEANANIMDNVFNSLKEDYIKTCQFEGEFKRRVNNLPEEVIGNILCKNRDIHIPKPNSLDSKDDCPEIAKRLDKSK